jgi:hypothetical protein
MVGVERTGEGLLRIVLNDRECRAKTAAVGGNYLLDSPFGIRVVLVDTGDAIEFPAEGHYGQLLKLLAETGVPLNTPVTTASGRVGDLADVYQDAVMRFSLREELVFIACALAYWTPPRRTWSDQFGNTYNFDLLMSTLLAQPLGQGSCGGCHLPYAVVTLLRVDEQTPILSPDLRARARSWLLNLNRLLEARCSELGGWDPTWAGGTAPRLLWGDDLLDRITVTGHHLEWTALAPLELRLSSTTIERAVVALRRDIAALPPLQRQPFKTLLPVSHAGRALALLRGDEPFSIWSQYWANGWLQRTGRGLGVKPDRPGQESSR